jgi:pyridoxal phosphate-dependent aminotransferase EpsN
MSGREQERVAEVFASNWIAPVGPHLNEFERCFAERLGVAHAAAVASGTAALHLALHRLELSSDDEVICPTFTFCASANPIRYESARPVFLDVDPATWNLDPQLLADELRDCAARQRLPKAVIAVDLLGQSADMDAILEVTNRYEVPVIEDAAEALGATYKDRAAGASGWASAFSFNGNKIITTSGGGMLCSNDATLIEKARHWATQAKEPGPLYYHTELGYNYRLSNVLAAIGIAQLEALDQRIAERRRVHEFYRRTLGELPGIRFMPQAEYGEPNYWLTVIRIDSSQFGATCESVRLALEAQNIESRRVWVPLHTLPLYADCRYRGRGVAESIFADALCLPSGSALSDDDLHRIATGIRRVCEQEGH